MARTVCFISEKGGVGKTTACFEIAIALKRTHNLRVLIVDADYQRGGITGRLDSSLIKNFTAGSMPGINLFHKFQQLYSASPTTSGIDIRSSSFNIDFIPADPRLASVSEDKLPSGKTIRQNSELFFEHLMVIAKVLSGLQDQYDYILIDSHPEVSSLLRAAIFASDYAVSPVKLDLQSSIGVPTVIAEINGVNGDVSVMQSTLGTALTYNPTNFVGAIGMMAREYAGDLKDSEDTEYRRLNRFGTMFQHYITEGDGIRRAAQNRTSVRNIGMANARKQTAQVDAITVEFLAKCP
ncbi:ParA family protein [Methylobacterium sp. 37f]|uniref:ParA family protein n=1 Tax=Methylobacterium sp. 37f TaxID=2817058 RepID=UPI001FFD8DC7|nr:ParA family protein [Methylobacterium sp. 37f]MCK2054789.1 ParA family protein [Methylobacterium sp. 37f]